MTLTARVVEPGRTLGAVAIFRFVVASCVCACLAVQLGCYESIQVSDASRARPFSGGEPMCDTELRVISGIPFRLSGKLRWVSCDGQAFDANAVATTVARVMRREGFDTRAVEFDNDDREPLAEAAEQNPLSLDTIDFVGYPFRQTAVIVSVEPLLVVIAERPVTTPYWSDAMNVVPGDIGESFVGLPGGVLYGPRVPVAGDYAILAGSLRSPGRITYTRRTDLEMLEIPPFVFRGEWRGDAIEFRVATAEAGSAFQ